MTRAHAILGALAALALVGAAPAPAPIPPETLADEAFIAAPVLSPDGTRIAARLIKDGKTKLMIFDLGQQRPKAMMDLGEVTLHRVSWAGNDRLLITTFGRASLMGLPVPITRLFAIDVHGGNARQMDKKSRGLLGGDVLYTDPNGKWALVSSQTDIFSTPSVKRVDLDTGESVTIEKPRNDVWNWYADSQGVVRGGIAYSGSRWTLWYRESADAPLRAIKAKKQPEGMVDGLRFIAADRSAMVLTNGKTGRFAAYRLDIDTGELGAAVYENPQVDVSELIVRGDGVVTGVAYEDDRRHVMWLDPALGEIQARVDKAFPATDNRLLDQSADGNRVLIWMGSASNPGSFFVFDRKARTMQEFARPYEKLSAVALAPVAPVRYPARDGLDIPAYLTVPLDRPAKDLPLIVYPHGGPFARDSWDYDPFVQFLASRGYAVLQPNFRGSTGYGKSYVEKGYGQWGRAMQDDLDDGVEWLVKAGKVDAKRVCILGTSYGGYAALWGAIRNPERYRCAVSIAGVTDLPAILRYDRRVFSAPRYYREWQEHVRGEKDADLSAVSPLAQQARLTVPVLIAHGERDTNVPPAQSHQLVSALEKRKADVQSVFYPEDGHGLTKRKDLIDFLGRLDTFLKKNNPA